VLFVQLVSLAVSQKTNIPVTRGIVAANAVIDTCLVAICLLVWRRRVPSRYAHVAAMAIWWAPVAASLCSYFVTQNTRLFELMLLETMSGVVMLSSAWLVGSYVWFDLLWLAVARTSEDLLFHTLSLLVVQIFVVVLQRLKIGTMLESERHRLAAVRQLEELQRSEHARAEMAEHLVHSQRLDAIGTLAAGLAHDMNNVLAAIMGLAYELAETTAQPATRDDLNTIVREAERGAELTRALLAFSRRGQYRRQILTIGEIVHDVVALLGRTLPKSIEIETKLDAPETCVEGDPTQFSQALVNLGINASDAMHGKGRLCLHGDVVELGAEPAAALQLAPGRYARVVVIDTGSGIDEATRARMFEPFFTTKALGKGTGLGLALVWGVVTKARGTVTVDSELGRGSTFSIYLPVAAGAPTPRVSQASMSRLPARGTVLVVDDEPAVRETTTRMVKRLGLAAIAASGGEECLQVMAQHEGEIAVVLLDMGMPGMSGAEVFEEIRARSNARIVIATGYAFEEQVQALVKRGARLLEKPFKQEALEREMNLAFGRTNDSA
jgi:signal transduction histidine kinase/CheY-like chemotaxis protein